MSLKKASVGTLRSKTVTSYRFSSNRLSLRRFPFPSGPAVAAVVNYIEDVFSTYLYTGNDSTQTITNGIDLSGKGGLVWMKARSEIASHAWYDTVRGATKEIESNSTGGEATRSTGLTAFNNNGFSIGSRATINTISQTYVSWTFRKQAKFFDVVTYTGTSSSFLTVNHNLGSIPGCIIVKCTTAGSSENWVVYHRSGGTYNGNLNLTGNFGSGPSFDNITSTGFRLTGNSSGVSTSGRSYVAYLFAHDAGGFGLTETDSVISCGSYTGNALNPGPTIELGWEPQWLLIKRTTGTGGSWYMYDIMRGLCSPVDEAYDDHLLAESSGAGGNLRAWFDPRPNGFQVTNNAAEINTSGANYIYIAIRRGPMKVPTSATSVFKPVYASSSGEYTANAGFVVDANIFAATIGDNPKFGARLLGPPRLLTNATNNYGFDSAGYDYFWDNNSNFRWEVTGDYSNRINWLFARAPKFFDIITWIGDGTVSRQITHNLTVAPELVIRKPFSTSGDAGIGHWIVSFNHSSSVGSSTVLYWNLTNAQSTGSSLGMAPATSTYVTGNAGNNTYGNSNGTRYIALLFATCPGISKVGTYTGTGNTLAIDCGFTAGARFIMIRRTDTTGDWYFWDSVRGISSGNDPYMTNITAGAQVTTVDWVDPSNAGFELSNSAGNDVNVNGGTYLFLAIA